MSPELIEAKVEAESLNQLYQKAFTNMLEQQHTLDVQKQIVQETQKYKDDIQGKLNKSIVRLKNAMDADQRLQNMAKLS